MMATPWAGKSCDSSQEHEISDIKLSDDFDIVDIAEDISKISQIEGMALPIQFRFSGKRYIL